MISKKLKTYLKENNWWENEEIEIYKGTIDQLGGISKDSDFYTFYSHVEQDAPTFMSDRGYELYHIGWFILYGDYLKNMEFILNGLNLSSEYIPLDTFEGEHGFFYNKYNDSIIELEIGECLDNFHKGIIDKQWKSFNSFLEWYFEIE